MLSPASLAPLQLRAGNVLGNVLEREEAFDAIHVGAAASSLPDVLVRRRRIQPCGHAFCA